MYQELDDILGDGNQNGVDRMVKLLEELRVEFRQSMEQVCKPVYRNENPIDVLVIEELSMPEKLVMVVLRNREEATLPQLMKLCGFNKQTGNRALNSLRNKGMVIKLRMSTYAMSNTNIF